MRTSKHAEFFYAGIIATVAGERTPLTQER